MLELNRVHCCDALEGLRGLPDGSVHCVVTSPPYWSLRDYNVEGQIGLEGSPEIYVAKMVEVFREVRRVLREDGCAWINLGDSYFGANWRGSEAIGTKQATNRGANASQKSLNPQTWRNMSHTTLKPKDLCGIPWRVAFALQRDGWWLRSAIIWAKNNPMPESCRDRPTSSYEFVFLLTKAARYYYDADAVREDWTSGRDDMRCHGVRTGSAYIQQGIRMDNSDKGPRKAERNEHDYRGGRNLRNVWTFPTESFSEAHFATFPKKLVEPCVRAGSPARVCAVCGAGWVRVVERNRLSRPELPKDDPRYRPHRYKGAYNEIKGEMGADCGYTETKTIGWRPSCECGAETKPAIVLDPFAGSGTAGVVALTEGRDFIGFDLNPDYCRMANERLQAVVTGVPVAEARQGQAGLFGSE